MKNTVLLLLLPLALASCQRRELTYYTEAEISVTADWSRAGQEEESRYGATLILYPQDGGAPRVALMGDRTRSTVQLPEGRYDALLFNRSFDDFGTVAFRGQDNLHTIEAYAMQTETRNETRVITSAPGKLASAVMRGFEVKDRTAQLHLVPAPLTRTVRMELHIEGIQNLKQATCLLSGVPLSILLHNGSTEHAERGMQEFEVQDITPDGDSGTGGTLSGTFQLFGMPAQDEAKIKLKALLKDNKTVVERQVENLEIREDADGNGVITLRIEAEVNPPLPDVTPSEGSGFDADVEEWGEENDTEIPI